jgi:hypothetical protein
MLRADPRLVVEIRETVRGFSLDKGRPETLHLAVVRPNGLAVGDRPGAAPRR